MLDLQINNMIYDKPEENRPISAKDFIFLIDSGDPVYFRGRNEDMLVLSEVLDKLPLYHLKVRLLQDYKGQHTTFSKGEEIDAEANEIYWPAEVDLPGKRLERLVRHPANP
ncbi:hypothetical protein GF358_01645 [Candidatus Woesearchaeota archaeon]|nr:hypothetical protein [Candidatus Woesearchaeota archaeon]